MTVAWVIGQARAMSRRAALVAARNCVRPNGHRTRKRSSSAVLNVRAKHLAHMGCLQQHAAVPWAVQPGMVHWRRRLLALLANFDRRNAERLWSAGMVLTRKCTQCKNCKWLGPSFASSRPPKSFPTSPRPNLSLSSRGLCLSSKNPELKLEETCVKETWCPPHTANGFMYGSGTGFQMT